MGLTPRAVFEFVLVSLLITACIIVYTARGRVEVLKTDLIATKADLKASGAIIESLQDSIKARAATDILQSNSRQIARERINTVYREVQKERDEDPTKCVASDSSLNRLRKLTEAGSSAIQSSSKLSGKP